MAKKNMKKLLVWVQGVSKTLIGLGVGFFATSGGLVIPNIPANFMVFAGWVIIGTTLWDAINTVTEAM